VRELEGAMKRRPLLPPPPGLLFFGCFSGRIEILDAARRLVVERFGPLHPEGVSPLFPFPATETYGETMGPDLRRQFFVVERRWPQDGLASVKREAIAMEEEIRERWAEAAGVERPINIDPGLINDCRIILATTKDHAHRIYRGEGIWEEITLVYRQGRYQPLPWTYRDFLNPAYHEFFEPLRREILEDFRRGPSAP
ncbi:MAG: DUF4416 family protein, partial [Planctomycetes bacterium]|nr:DUF4416 family protein [Planctomycetota bacterium]